MIYVVGVQGCPKGEGSKFKPNKNGVWPVILKSVNGVSLPPNSDILDGSVAASMGVEVGNTYMLMIVEKDPYVHTDGKIYKKYDYTVVGGNASQQIATEMAKSVIVDISAMIARPSTSASTSPSPSVLTQPVINADEAEAMAAEAEAAAMAFVKAGGTATSDDFASMSSEQLEALQKKLTAAKKAAKAADVPF